MGLVHSTVATPLAYSPRDLCVLAGIPNVSSTTLKPAAHIGPPAIALLPQEVRSENKGLE